MIVGIAVAAVLLIGGGITTPLVLTSGDDNSQPSNEPTNSLDNQQRLRENPMTSPPEQPEDPGAPRANRSKAGLTVGIGVAAVLVIGGITLALVLGGEDDERSGSSAGGANDNRSTPSAPQDPIGDDTDSDGSATADETAVTQVAQQAVTALNDGDAELAESIACNPRNVGDDFGTELPAGTRVRLVGKPSIDESQARVPTEFAGHGSPSKTEIPVHKTDGDWCVVMTTTP